MTHARRRLIRDFKKLQEDPPYGVSGAPVQNDIMQWKAVIFGPEDTPWEGATFHLEMNFGEEYPNKAPEVKFVSKLFHPNVYNDGNICLDILQSQWSPIYDISAILTSIQSLLTDPNPNSPANLEAASLYAENRREYNRRVQQCVKDSWSIGEAELTPAAERNNTSSNPTRSSSSSHSRPTPPPPLVDSAPSASRDHSSSSVFFPAHTGHSSAAYSSSLPSVAATSASSASCLSASAPLVTAATLPAELLPATGLSSSLSPAVSSAAVVLLPTPSSSSSPSSSFSPPSLSSLPSSSASLQPSLRTCAAVSQEERPRQVRSSSAEVVVEADEQTNLAPTLHPRE